MKRLEYIDILRGISIMGVVLIHVVSMLGGVEASIWHIIFLGLTRYCVPMFFVCMGAIQLRKDRELDIHKLYTKNIPRFLVAIFLLEYMDKWKSESLHSIWISRLCGARSLSGRKGIYQKPKTCNIYHWRSRMYFIHCRTGDTSG